VSKHLTQHVYIWQRQWTAENSFALQQSRSVFSTLHILAAQDFPQEGWVNAHINPEALRQDGRPVIAVFRLDGQLKHLDIAGIQTQIQRSIDAWQQSGIHLIGIEIDHDCGTSRLTDYALLLHQLRTHTPKGLTLGITAIPDWMGSPQLPLALAQVDYSVLQVHAVQRITQGLFDLPQALVWTHRYASLTSRPFWLAVPAYGIALTTDEQVESEVTLPVSGPRHEIRVDPVVVAQLIQQLEQLAYPTLQGILWFRLPLASDQRAWSMVTLKAVSQGQPLYHKIEAEDRPASGASSIHDIFIKNSGNLDVRLPDKVVVSGQQCDTGDGVGAYQLDHTSDSWIFRRTSNVSIPAQSATAIGWLHCTQIQAIAIP